MDDFLTGIPEFVGQRVPCLLITMLQTFNFENRQCLKEDC